MALFVAVADAVDLLVGAGGCVVAGPGPRGARPDDGAGSCRVLQDRMAGRAEKQAGEAASAARSHYRQRGACRLGDEDPRRPSHHDLPVHKGCG